jgi:acetolactate decarboxylase
MDPQAIIRWTGALQNVLERGDLSSHFELSTLAGLPHMYGLGPVEQLAGEVTILDSVPSIAQVINNQIVTSVGLEGGACFFVYAQVPRWRLVTLPMLVRTDVELEAVLPTLGGAGPFPFLLRTTPSLLRFHVINKTNKLPHDLAQHEKAKVKAELSPQKIEALGFYSEAHRGVFIPRTRNLHIHFVTESKDMSGHVDEMVFGAETQLYVPDEG